MGHLKNCTSRNGGECDCGFAMLMKQEEARSLAAPENPPAFARSAATVKEWEGGDEHEVTYEPYVGMSLRDYFAAKAMQGYYAAGKWGVMEAGTVSEWSYQIADAMLKERSK